jgi:hypothetical protein
MDKVMAFLMKYVGGFMAWWKDITGLEYRTYNMWLLGPTGVSWAPVSFGLLVIVLMALLLPTGLADRWGWFWYG